MKATSFQRLVADMVAMFGHSEDKTASILLDLFRRGIFKWRTL